MESANTASLAEQFRLLGRSDDEILRAFRSFSAWAWQFRQASEGAKTGTVHSNTISASGEAGHA
jgi:hypothetical protein